MASIQTRRHKHSPDTYRVCWRANGNRHYSPTFDTEREAEDFIKLLEAEKVRSGFLPDLTKPQTPFRLVAQEWLDNRSKHLSPSTVNKNRASVAFVNQTFGNTPIAAIRRQDVQRWVDEAVINPADDCEDCEHTRSVAGDDDARCRAHVGTKALAPSTLQSYYGTFGAIMRDAQLDGYLPNGVPIGKHIIRLPATQSRMIFLADTEVDLLLETAVRGFPAHAALVHLLAHTGMRVGEVTALRRSDYNPLAKWVDVVRSGRRQTTKTGRRRRIDLDDCCVAAVNAHLAGHDFDVIFSGPRGSIQHVTNWRRQVWYPLIEEAGFADIGLHIHDLRHSHATSLFGAGWQAHEIAERLGHSSTKMTLDRYGHAQPGRQAKLLREKGMRAQ